MKDKLTALLDLNDPATKQSYDRWDKGDCSDVGLCEILLRQLINKHKNENGEFYNTDYDEIKTRY
jgi:hypothetical protein